MTDCIGCMTAKDECWCQAPDDAITRADKFSAQFAMLPIAGLSYRRHIHPRRTITLAGTLPQRLRELEEAGR